HRLFSAGGRGKYIADQLFAFRGNEQTLIVDGATARFLSSRLVVVRAGRFPRPSQAAPRPAPPLQTNSRRRRRRQRRPVQSWPLQNVLNAALKDQPDQAA